MISTQSEEEPAIESSKQKPCMFCGEAVRGELKQDQYSYEYFAVYPTRHANCENISDHLTYAGVPKIFHGVEPVETKGDGLYLYGQAGTGKSYRMAQYCKWLTTTHKLSSGNKEWARNAIEYTWVNVPRLLVSIQSSFNSPTASVDDIVDDLVTQNILFIDDLGAEKATDWSTQTLYVIINGLWENGGRLYVTSNNSPAELATTLGDRMMSRILAMATPLKIEGEDKRLS